MSEIADSQKIEANFDFESSFSPSQEYKSDHIEDLKIIHWSVFINVSEHLKSSVTCQENKLLFSKYQKM